MMNEQKIAIQNFQTNLHPVYYRQRMCEKWNCWVVAYFYFKSRYKTFNEELDPNWNCAYFVLYFKIISTFFFFFFEKKKKKSMVI